MPRWLTLSNKQRTRKTLHMTWKSILREFVPPIMMRAIRPTSRGEGYISAAATIAAAHAAGLSVGDYVERLWQEPGGSASIIKRLREIGAISSATKSVVEIGCGTGRYIEHTLKCCRPTVYQIYETDDAWASWAAKSYPVEACAADGRSLKSTKSNSTDLIHAHGVFVYLPFMISYRYFKEIARVAAPGAFVAFDICSEACFDTETAEKWLASDHNWPCFLSTAYVRQFFDNNGFVFIESFLAPFDVGWSEYLIFRQPTA
jgi:SAM-dependent methyltransferase